MLMFQQRLNMNIYCIERIIWSFMHIYMVIPVLHAPLYFISIFFFLKYTGIRCSWQNRGLMILRQTLRPGSIYLIIVTYERSFKTEGFTSSCVGPRPQPIWRRAMPWRRRFFHYNDPDVIYTSMADKHRAMSHEDVVFLWQCARRLYIFSYG